MTADSWIIVVGTVAGFCTTFAFVPQLIKIWKQGERDLSYGMLALYLIGAILFATAIVITVAAAMKAWTARRDDIRASVVRSD